ncbi:zinc-finger of transposase IS204/IS1001/IS1096/IS1165 [Caldicellulosiruptor bescii]|uniref:Zinc-finger of transposase IS204/IS1001/IS1096/IS1165 n=1 Tax=Caldicellulosiruptor bescii TaxID=31899 RepID=A0ABY1S7K3_CALBS|nr:zinc-finger of transposase IS204/IS1001/IS1096/IS1165 [Caldicellulosiruptor bescii]
MEKYEIIDDTIYIYVKSKNSQATCPYCNQSSNKIHSYYSRSFQDLPIQDKKVVIVLKNRKFFCKNPECRKKHLLKDFNLSLITQKELKDLKMKY